MRATQYRLCRHRFWPRPRAPVCEQVQKLFRSRIIKAPKRRLKPCIARESLARTPHILLERLILDQRTFRQNSRRSNQRSNEKIHKRKPTQTLDSQRKQNNTNNNVTIQQLVRRPSGLQPRVVQKKAVAKQKFCHASQKHELLLSGENGLRHSLLEKGWRKFSFYPVSLEISR